MSAATNGRLSEVLEKHGPELLTEWTQEQLAASRRGLIKEGELRDQCSHFLGALQAALRSGDARAMQGELAGRDEPRRGGVVFRPGREGRLARAAEPAEDAVLFQGGREPGGGHQPVGQAPRA